jgi:hypothetical protein
VKEETMAEARCERTGKSIPLSNGYLVANASTGDWFFVCEEAEEGEYEYYFPLASMLRSPESFVDHMAHLNEKTWFDSGKFFAFFDRLRADNEIYGHL